MKAVEKFGPADGLEFGSTIHAILGQCDGLKVFLNIMKDLCNFDLTTICNFKYCFIIGNK